MKKAIIVEFEHYHHQVIIPQCLMLLEAGYTVDLFINRKMRDYKFIDELDERVHVTLIDRKWKWKTIFQLWFEINRRSCEFVLIDTYLPLRRHHLLMSTLRHPVRYIVHRVHEYLQQPNTVSLQVLHRRVDRIFVLSASVKEHFIQQAPSAIRAKISYFYPMKYAYSDKPLPELFRSEGKIRFAVPGEIRSDRRNYQTFFNLLGKLAASPLANRIQIFFLGNADTELGKLLIEAAQTHGLLNRTLYFNEQRYELAGSYYAKLAQMHYLIPLTNYAGVNLYYRYTTPASMKMSMAFCIPVIRPDEFATEEVLERFSLTYHDDDLFSALENAVELFDSGAYGNLRESYRQYLDTCYKETKQLYFDNE